MSVNYFNAEKYPDPTAYEALSDIVREENRTQTPHKGKSRERQRENRKKYKSAHEPMKAYPWVYICSPFSGDTKKNTIQARKYSRFAVKNESMPITPHLLYPQFLQDANPIERKIGLHFGSALLENCSEMWVFGDCISSGMKAEIETAQQAQIKIRYFTEKCEEVLK